MSTGPELWHGILTCTSGRRSRRQGCRPCWCRPGRRCWVTWGTWTRPSRACCVWSWSPRTWCCSCPCCSTGSPAGGARAAPGTPAVSPCGQTGGAQPPCDLWKEIYQGLLVFLLLLTLLSKAQGCKDFWQPSKPSYVGILWSPCALDESSLRIWRVKVYKGHLFNAETTFI